MVSAAIPNSKITAMACSFTFDRLFGPSVHVCRRAFDFTLLFEEIFFQLLPSGLFLIATITRVWLLHRRPRIMKRCLFYTLKLFAFAAFAVLQVVTLVLVCVKSGNSRTYLSIPAASISVVAAIALLILSLVEETRSARPSFTISIYLSVTVLLRSATARTYWHISSDRAIASTTIAAVVVQIVLIVLESCCKKQDLGDERGKASIEETAGFLSRSLFTWLDRLFFTGYRKALSPSDLKSIDRCLSAPQLASDFESLQKNPTARFGLLGETLRCLGIYAFAPVLPRLCLTGFTFAQPFLTTSLIAYFSQESSSQNDGYGLVGAAFLVYVGLAVSTGWYWHLAYKCVTKIRGGLVAAISEKMMHLRQEKGVEAKVLTLMITDAQRIMNALVFGHEFWIAPIETGIATWLLWRQIGPSSLTVLGIALISTIGSTFIGKNIGKQQQVWLTATEKRISATKKMLSSLKAIKMMGMSEKVGMTIEKLRNLEFAASKSFRTLIVGTLFSSYSTLTLAPVVAFGAYIGAANATFQEFDASRMFASLILINLLASPLIRLLQIIPSFGAAMGCFTRLEQFLKRPEGVEPRKSLVDISERSSGQFEIEDTHPEKCSNHGKKDLPEVFTTRPILSIRNGDFGWEQTVLKNINLEVNSGEHIAITGPVGCGKSLLLLAILGEIEPKEGSIHIGRADIGYCSQNAWLENSTARENAFRCSTGDEQWEKTVIEACALRDFFDSQTPDNTIGSGGMKLSGGEKQRLALARAIALRPGILLLDDVLSAIDRTTKKKITESLFGSDGILAQHGITIIHITQDLSVARMADRAFRIDKNGGLENLEPLKNPAAEEVKDVVADSPKPTAISSISTKPTHSPRKEGSSPPIAGDIMVYRTYLNAIQRPNVLVFFVCAIAFAFTLNFPAVWVKWWSDDATGNQTKSTSYWIGLYTLLSILPLVMVSLWVAHLMLEIVPKSGVGLHLKLLNSVLGAPFVTLSAIDSGSIINRFNQDLMLVDTKLPLDLLNTASSLFTCIAQVVLVVFATVYLFAALPVLALVLFIVQHVYLRTSKQLRQLDLQSKSGLHTKLSESWEGLITIRAHRWQSTIRREFHEKLDRSQEPLYLLFMVQTWLRVVSNLVVAGLSVTVVGIAVATRHQTAASSIGVAFLNLVSLGETITNLVTSWTSLETSLGAIARIKAFEEDMPQEPHIERPINPSASWPSFGNLVFDNVSASYNADAEKPVWSLHNVGFEIRAGERVAVCGRSGAGKSSLFLSLLGLIKPSKGTITLDGIDISRLPGTLLRSRLCVISQDAFTHGETVREALLSEHDLADDVINDVLRDCSLLDKINISGGLSTKLDTVNLSIGETQLFVLARTILQAGSERGGVVLFDEATSSIDVATEYKIMSLLKDRLKGKTVISILHRLEAAMEYDRILVLEAGEVVCFGTPAEVVRDAGLFDEFRKRPVGHGP